MDKNDRASVWIGNRIIPPYERVNEILTRIWQDPEVGLQAPQKFWLRIKKQFAGISQKQVYDFVKSQQMDQVMRPRIRAKVNKPILMREPNAQWQADLIEMKNPGLNNGVNYLLTVIDCFSKYAFVFPVESKEGSEIMDAFADLFANEGAPKSISTDNGGEFNNKELEDLFSQYDIKKLNSKPYNSKAHGQVERFNRTIQSKIKKFMIQYDSKHYLDALPSIVKNYNSQEHLATGYAPIEIHFLNPENEEEKKVIDQVYEKLEKRAAKWLEATESLFEDLVQGDFVRLAQDTQKEIRKKKIFRKGYEQQWGNDIYRIAFVNYPKKKTQPIIYRVMSDDGEILPHEYFRDMLQKIDVEELKSFDGERPDFSDGKIFIREKFLRELAKQKSAGEEIHPDVIEEVNLQDEKVEEEKEEEKKEKKKNEEPQRKSSRQKKQSKTYYPG
jgi:hypothetical protein